MWKFFLFLFVTIVCSTATFFGVQAQNHYEVPRSSNSSSWSAGAPAIQPAQQPLTAMPLLNSSPLRAIPIAPSTVPTAAPVALTPQVIRPTNIASPYAASQYTNSVLPNQSRPVVEYQQAPIHTTEQSSPLQSPLDTTGQSSSLPAPAGEQLQNNNGLSAGSEPERSHGPSYSEASAARVEALLTKWATAELRGLTYKKRWQR